jgi:hypothetical protein
MTDSLYCAPARPTKDRKILYCDRFVVNRHDADRVAGAAVHGTTTQVQAVLAEAAVDEHVVVGEAFAFIRRAVSRMRAAHLGGGCSGLGSTPSAWATPTTKSRSRIVSAKTMGGVDSTS